MPVNSTFDFLKHRNERRPEDALLLGVARSVGGDLERQRTYRSRREPVRAERLLSTLICGAKTCRGLWVRLRHPTFPITTWIESATKP
jgi:hypothetical protein